MMVGIAMQGILGEHNALAASGTLLHFINHSMLKLVPVSYTHLSGFLPYAGRHHWVYHWQKK